MSLNSSDPVSSLEPTQNQAPEPAPEGKSSKLRKVLLSFGLPLWAFLGFMLAQALVLAVIAGLQLAKVPLETLNPIIINAAGAAVIYALTLLIVLGVPWLAKRRPTTKRELGLQRLPNWIDIAWTPVGVVAYIALTSLITALAVMFLPFVDYGEAQDTGFTGIGAQYEYILAFASLVIIAPIAEEILFRGYLFGKLKKYAPVWVAVIVSSALFAIVHFQWNVALDTFALGVVMCLLRIVSGSLWPSIMLHMLKNGTAFYFLFINPTLLSTLGG